MSRMARILVVDDEADLRELLELTVVAMGYEADCADSLASARNLLSQHEYALCLTDMKLPDGSGIDLVAEISSGHPQTPVAMITAFGSAEAAVAALKAGAFDFLPKPVALETLRALIHAAVGSAATVVGHVQPGNDDVASGLLGKSPAIEQVRASIRRLARSMAPVAIRGESGTGKEMAARLVHLAGGRSRGPFIAVNCGAIPETLMESEFFGYRKGAFTGANEDRTGFFQAANGGTLFLDEVADLPLSMQVKLLRAIQEKRVRKIGSTNEEPVDVRIVSATHQDLAACVASGRFRQDLFYRLNVIELVMPPLRERPQDVPMLARAILVRLAERASLRSVPRISSVAERYLCSYSFPGNVRELENVLERAIAFSDGATINVEDLGLRPEGSDALANERAEVPPAGALGSAVVGASEPEPLDRTVPVDGVPTSLPDYLDRVEREAIARALEKSGHNRTAAARLLGITFRALRYRMQRLGMN